MLDPKEYFERIMKSMSNFPAQVGTINMELPNYIIRFRRGELVNSDFQNVDIYMRVPYDKSIENEKIGKELMEDFDKYGKPQMQEAFTQAGVICKLPEITDSNEEEFDPELKEIENESKIILN